MVSLGGAVIAAVLVGSIIESAQKTADNVIKVGKATPGGLDESGPRRAG